MPTLVEIPGHPTEQYVASVLERFANPGVRDQIARLCVDGSAKVAKFLIPTIARQLEVNGPIEGSATALAGWARYLAVVEPDAQAFDSNADAARRHAVDAVGDPVAFLQFDAVFPPAMQASRRFGAEFSAAYRRVAENGPIAAMEAGPHLERTGDSR